MSSRVRVLKPLLIAAGMAGLLPALGSAQGVMPHRKAGMWESTMMMAGRSTTTGMCTDEAFERRMALVNPQQMGARDCSNMTPKSIPGGYRIEGTCTTGGRTTHIVATIKGDLSRAYTMDTDMQVDGKPGRPMHMDVKWTGPCGSSVKPGDMVMSMPNGQRVVMNMDAMRERAAAAGAR